MSVNRSRVRAEAFTLIEILVVVAIIALLISILLPSLSAAREQARNARCLANMRDMATGANTFAVSHKGRFQLVTGDGALSNSSSYDAAGPKADLGRSLFVYESGPLPMGKQGPALLAWPAALLREAGNRSIKRNADWGVEAGTREEAMGKVKEFELTRCPADKLRTATSVYPETPNGRRWFGSLSYAINEDIAGDDRTNGGKNCFKDGAANSGERLQGAMERIIRPSEVLLVVDGGLDRANPGGKEPWNLILSRNASAPYLEFAQYMWNNRLPDNRHQAGGLNISYPDGHGGSVKKFRNRYAPGTKNVNDWAYRPKVRVSPYNVGALPPEYVN